MGDASATLSDELRSFLSSQSVFFVATAHLGTDGHVNVSPKGLDTLRVLSDREIAYLDLTGAGTRPAPTCSRTAGSC